LSTVSETSDGQLLELIRHNGPLSVSAMAEATDVTPTAVRQRLTRLMAQGLVERQAEKAGRGRPSHRYSLTEKARRQTGTNYADLALVLWKEIRSISDPAIRRGLLERLAGTMAAAYGPQITGDTTRERMQSIKKLFSDRNVGFSVDGTAELPVLTALDCPYPDLVAQDRGICALEKMLFSRILDENVRLSQCRLDGGGSCCQFEINQPMELASQPCE
jgi:predicted ArsR family transcriptional regulator